MTAKNIAYEENRVPDALDKYGAMCDDCLRDFAIIGDAQTTTDLATGHANDGTLERRQETCRLCDTVTTVNHLK